MIKRIANLSGIIGGVFFAISSIPQMILSIKTGSSEMSVGTIWLWLVGGFAMAIFSIASSYIGDIKTKVTIILLINYVLCVMSAGVIVYYKYFPRI